LALQGQPRADAGGPQTTAGRLLAERRLSSYVRKRALRERGLTGRERGWTGRAVHVY